MRPARSSRRPPRARSTALPTPRWKPARAASPASSPGSASARSDRVGTLAWNGYRHLEVYYAAPGMRRDLPHHQPAAASRRHRLHHQPRRGRRAVRRDQLCRAARKPSRHAVNDCVRAVVLMTDAANMPALALPRRHGAALLRRPDGRGGRRLHLAQLRGEPPPARCATPRAPPAGRRACCTPPLDRAARLRHRHAGRAVPARHSTVSCRSCRCSTSTPGAFRTARRWPAPRWCCPAGTSTAPAWHALLNAERVTFTCGVPTVWLGLLAAPARQRAKSCDTVTPDHDRRLGRPPLLIEAFGDEYGVAVEHGWGMTELSPVGTYNAPKPAHAGLTKAERRRT